jgi:hypothetical protein
MFLFLLFFLLLLLFFVFSEMWSLWRNRTSKK